jgi:hypothetical protein
MLEKRMQAICPIVFPLGRAEAAGDVTCPCLVIGEARPASYRLFKDAGWFALEKDFCTVQICSYGFVSPFSTALRAGFAAIRLPFMISIKKTSYNCILWHEVQKMKL